MKKEENKLLLTSLRRKVDDTGFNSPSSFAVFPTVDAVDDDDVVCRRANNRQSS